MSYQLRTFTVDATAKSIFPLADCKGPGLSAAGQKRKRKKMRDSPPLEDLIKPFPQCIVGAAGFVLGKAHTFMDILTLLASAYIPSSPSESIPTHRAPGPQVEKRRFGVDKQTEGWRWMGGSAGAEKEESEFDRQDAARVNMASNKPQDAPSGPRRSAKSALMHHSS